MRRMMSRLLLGGLLGWMAVGCAEERDPINRVQPNAIPKSFFIGNDLRSPDDDPEFRTKSYTVGSSVSQTAYTYGEFTAVDRIRWEITEDLLIARRAYQEVEGTDNRGVPKSQWDQNKADKNLVKAPNGTIVAAFRIQSHFDIRRSYNPSTGEESNVIEENTSDRPWQDRQYMRIDWSQNLVSSTNDSTRYFNWAKVTPVAYTVTDPSAEDAPHFETEAGYFDVTNKFTVEPAEIEMPWGNIKECQLTSFLTGSPSYDCNPQEATVRTSFARVSPDEDFERFEDTTAWRDVVGNWGGSGDGAQPWLGTARMKWDPQYGYTDALTRRFKAIHNIWKKSHQGATCTADVDTDKNGTADQCENALTGYSGRGGSRCDVYEGRCTIPVRDREIKTIAYHFNKEAPDELQDQVDAQGKLVSRGTLEDMPYTWNQLLEVAVAYQREVECRRTGEGDRASCHAQFFEGDGGPESKTMVSFGGWLVDKVKKQDVDKGKPVLTACHNPVRAYDQEEACGKVGSTARFGDIRKNFLNYWPYESRAHYGGVGANPPDPLTGETFGASATIMGRSATYAAALQRDIVQVALGDTSMDDIIKGVPSQRYQAILRDGKTAPTGLTQATTREDMAARIAAMDMTSLKTSIAFKPFDGSARDLAVDATKQKAKSSVDPGQMSQSLAQFDALASKLRGSKWEAQVVDSHWLLGTLGTAPGTTSTNDMLALASPLRGLDPVRIDAMNMWRDAYLESKGACFDDVTLVGAGSVYQPSLAGFFRTKYGDLDPVARGRKIYEDLWREAVKGIGIHELGHSLGLRHNFASSWDAPNYNPQYWQLRTNEGKSSAACAGPRAGSDDTCMGPRYLDPMTADEQGLGGESRPGIDYFGNTSVMEYQLERFGETVGVGPYDLHAMKTLYGRVLETFDDRVVPLADQVNFAAKNYTQLQERDLVVDGSKVFSHYTKTARLMKVFDPQRDCRAATPEEKNTATWRVVHDKVCSPPPKDHWAFNDFTSEEIPDFGITAVKWHTVDSEGKNRVRWNYRYGEQYGGGGYMHTTMQDAGADIYEITQNLNRRFELSYPWAYFRRGNAEYNYFGMPEAIASRYFSRVRAYHWQVGTELGRAKPADLEDDDGVRPYVMAQGDIFNFLTRAVMMPEPGDYMAAPSRTPLGSTRQIFDVNDRTKAPAFTIGITDGRYVGEDFDNEVGGSWDYQKYVNHAGFEVEKSLALMQLIDPRPTLFTIARDNFLDGRGPMISFRTDLPDGVDRLVGGLLSEDWETVAPAVDAQGVPSQLDVTRRAVQRPANARIVFPNIGYKQQLMVAMYSALFSRLNTDMTLLNKLRLWIDGDRAPIVPDASQVRFTDPATGFTYTAAKFGTDTVDGKAVDRGIASRMIQHANATMAAAYKVKRDASEQPVLDAYGRPQLELGADGRPQLATGTPGGRAPADIEADLRKYIGLVDALRQIQGALGNGPLGGASQEGE